MSATVPILRDAFDPLGVRADFPVLARHVHGKPLVYVDNANTAQKPIAVSRYSSHRGRRPKLRWVRSRW